MIIIVQNWLYIYIINEGIYIKTDFGRSGTKIWKEKISNTYENKINNIYIMGSISWIVNAELLLQEFGL